MALIRTCDERHDHPTKAEYRVIKVNDLSNITDEISRDYCYEHFRKVVGPLMTGGLRDNEAYHLSRIGTEG